MRSRILFLATAAVSPSVACETPADGERAPDAMAHPSGENIDASSSRTPPDGSTVSPRDASVRDGSPIDGPLETTRGRDRDARAPVDASNDAAASDSAFPPTTGRFVDVQGFRDLGADALTQGVVTTLIPVDYDGDGLVDLVRTGRGAGTVDVVLQQPDGWSVVPLSTSGGAPEQCYTAADLVSDAALDLLCRRGDELIAVHGLLGSPGGTSITPDATRVAAGMAAIGGGVPHVLVHDLNDDGCSELLISTFEEGAADQLLWCSRDASGVQWKAVASGHVGMTFAAGPWRDGDASGVLYMTESGTYQADWNENQVLLWQGGRAFAPLYDAPDPACDPRGYLRPPTSPYKGTPMGYTRWRPHRTGTELVVMTQDVEAFPLFEKNGAGDWCDVGTRDGLAMPASTRQSHHLFQWGARALPRPAGEGGELLVVASGHDGPIDYPDVVATDRAGDRFAGLQVYDWPSTESAPRELGASLGMPEGDFVSLSLAPIDEGCSPDIAAGRFRASGRVLLNELSSDPSGAYACFLVLGHGGESAEVVIDGSTRVAVEDASPWSASVPYVFEFIEPASDLTVDVRWPGRASAVRFTVPPGHLVRLMPDGTMR